MPKPRGWTEAQKRERDRRQRAIARKGKVSISSSYAIATASEKKTIAKGGKKASKKKRSKK